MTTPAHIRLATLADLPAIQAMATLFFQEESAINPDLNTDWPVQPAGEAYYRRMIEDDQSVCLVLEYDGRLIGYAEGSMAKTPGGRPVKRAEFDNLFIVKPHRGAGYGKQLLRTFAQWAHEQGAERVINAARRNLWVTTAYFAPDTRVLQALCQAARRGVDVRILTNGPHTNHKVVRRAGHGSYRDLLASGVKIYEYHKTLLHCKIMTADGIWATVGSINFDARSLVLNDELNLSVLDRGVTEQLDRQFQEDLQDSLVIAQSHWDTRGWPSRVIEFMTRLVRDQL